MMSIFGPSNPESEEQKKIEEKIKKVAALKAQEAAEQKALDISLAAEEQKQAEKRKELELAENNLAKLKRETKSTGWF
jgi:hypothetical protein